MTEEQRLARNNHPSISDVARLAGVSMGTVSNTLNKPEKVSEPMRRKVESAIAELGFVRNDAARSLAAGSSTTVGVVLADLKNSYFVDIARGVEDVLRRQGMSALIADTDVDPAREIKNLKLFEQARVAGIVFAPLDTTLARSGVLPVRSTPVVLVNYPSVDGTRAAVLVDERKGGALAARHLLELGRMRLLFVGGPMHLAAVKDRYDGAREEARSAGATIALLETTGLDGRHGRRAAQEILGRGVGLYDGIIAASDLLAISLMQTLSAKHGFATPADIAVTGYDNNHFGAETPTPVTTISQPGLEMGRVAADLLIERLRNPDAPIRETVLDPRLIPRSSTLGTRWSGDTDDI